jgi:hypothetical protein
MTNRCPCERCTLRPDQSPSDLGLHGGDATAMPLNRTSPPKQSVEALAASSSPARTAAPSIN